MKNRYENNLSTQKLQTILCNDALNFKAFKGMWTANER